MSETIGIYLSLNECFDYDFPLISNCLLLLGTTKVLPPFGLETMQEWNWRLKCLKSAYEKTLSHNLYLELGQNK